MKFLVFLFLFIIPSTGFAGECVDYDSNLDYLKNIQKSYTEPLSKDKKLSLQYDIYCLADMHLAYYHMGFDHFASPTVLQKIKDENAPSKALAHKILPKYINDSDKDFACTAIRALAYYNYPLDFKKLESCVGYEGLTLTYAIFQDPLAIPGAIKRYWELENKYKTKPQFSYQDKLDMLNVLYHLSTVNKKAAKQVLAFVNKVLQDPKPKKIGKKALKIKNRALSIL